MSMLLSSDENPAIILKQQSQRNKIQRVKIKITKPSQAQSLNKFFTRHTFIFTPLLFLKSDLRRNADRRKLFQFQVCWRVRTNQYSEIHQECQSRTKMNMNSCVLQSDLRTLDLQYFHNMTIKNMSLQPYLLPLMDNASGLDLCVEKKIFCLIKCYRCCYGNTF